MLAGEKLKMPGVVPPLEKGLIVEGEDTGSTETKCKLKKFSF